MSRCRGCSVEVRWVVYPSGKLAPLDVDPHPAGNVVLRAVVGAAPRAEVLGPLELELLDPDVPRYMPHHATCPDVERFRR